MGLPSRESFTKPEGDELIAGALVVGAVVLLVILAHVFKDVAPA